MDLAISLRKWFKKTCRKFGNKQAGLFLLAIIFLSLLAFFVLSPPPTQGTPILNSTFGTHTINENLTLHNISTTSAVTNIIAWNMNNISLLYLSLPFDTNYSNHSELNGIKDYSGNNNNGTQDKKSVIGSINWTNGSNCVSGGCYVFNGINSSITFDLLENKAVNIPSGGNFSVTMWVNVNGFGGSNNADRILDNQEPGPENGFTIGTLNRSNPSSVSNMFQLSIRNGSLQTVNIVSGNISTGVWYFVAAAYGPNDARLYVNGTLVDSVDISNSYNVSLSNLTIGRRAASNSNKFNGSLDELKIWNWTLTPQQVMVEYNNGIPKGNVLSSTMLAVNDNWQGCITPNDGLYDGYTNCSDNVTIESFPASLLNYPPNNTISASDTASFVCNATDLTGLSNITLFANFNGSYIANRTVELSGFSNGTNMTVSGIRDGRFIWNCLAADTGNNKVFNSTNYTITIDTTIPSDITLNAPANRSNSSSANVLFNISAADNLDTNLTCNITLDGIFNKTLGVQSSGSNSSSITINGIGEGSHQWNTTCFDNANNSNSSTTRQLLVDTIRPAVNLSLNDTALEFSRDSVLIGWNATDINLDRYYANVSYPNGSSLNQLANKSQQYILGPGNLTLTGTYNITVYATDGAGNFNATSLTFTVTDTTMPISILISPPNNTVIAIKNISFVCNATNTALSNISLYSNTNGSWTVNATANVSGTANQSNFTVNGIADGTYTWNCLAKDTSNNQAFNSTNYTITVDTTVPSGITLNAPANRSNSSSSGVLFNISATDNIDTNLTCNITLDGIFNKTLGVQSSGSNSSAITINGIADGSHLWNATCFDNANNSNTSTTRLLTVDTTRPAVNLSLNDTALEFNVDSILIEWNATDINLDRYYANVSYPNGSLLSQLTNKSQQYILGPSNLTLTGTYNVTVFATDNAGNSNATSLTFSVNYTTSPTVLLVSPANNSAYAIKNVSFVCNATNTTLSNLSLYTNTNGSWAVNATALISGTANQSNFTVTGIADGTYIWNCLATDTNNNKAFDIAGNRTLEIDTLAPSQVTLLNPASQQRLTSTNSSAIFNVTANDGVDHNLTCNITLDGIANKSLGVRANGGNINSSSINITGLAGGVHQWNATCFDNANNSNTSQTFNFTINRMPDTPSISQPADGSYLNNRTIAWTAADSDSGDTLVYYLYVSNGSAFNTINFSNLTLTQKQHAFANLQELNWFAKVISNDGLENSSDSAIINFILDMAKPNIALSAPLEGQSVTEGDINLTYNVSDSNGVSNCTLVFSGNANQTDVSVSANIAGQSFAFNKQAGTYTWQVYCTDLAGNVNASEIRNLTLAASPGSGSGAAGSSGGSGGGGTLAKKLKSPDAEVPEVWDYNETRIMIRLYDADNKLVVPKKIRVEFSPRNDFTIVSQNLSKDGSVIIVKPWASASGKYIMNITINDLVSKTYEFNLGEIRVMPALENITKSILKEKIAFSNGELSSKRKSVIRLVAIIGGMFFLVVGLFAYLMRDFIRHLRRRKSYIYPSSWKF